MGDAGRLLWPKDDRRDPVDAEQQLVEIARALHAKSRLLALDEPTTPLSSRETDLLFALIRQLRSEGIAISHRMAEIYEPSDRVAMLRDGGCVDTLEKGQINASTTSKASLRSTTRKQSAPTSPLGNSSARHHHHLGRRRTGHRPGVSRQDTYLRDGLPEPARHRQAAVDHGDHGDQIMNGEPSESRPS